MSTRLAFEHDMNVERQKRRIQMRADEARQHGDHELAEYLLGLGEVFQGDVDAGRPEPASHYWPMAEEEFGDDRPDIQRNPGFKQGMAYAVADGTEPVHQIPTSELLTYRQFDPRNPPRLPEAWAARKPADWALSGDEDHHLDRTTVNEDDEEMPSLTDSIQAEGIKVPLEILTDGERAYLSDGLHRATVAHESALPHAPAHVINMSPEDLDFQASQVYHMRGGNIPSAGPAVRAAIGGRTAARRLAFDPGGHDAPPPEMDWDPVMQSIRDTGGYTIGDAGEAPTSGYMISLPGTEERRPTDTVTPDTEADYHKRHWDQLREDPDLDQGGWDSSGTFYTDLSRNDQDLYRTIGDAVTTDQESIYDLNQGQVLDTMDNPETSDDDYNPLLVGPGTIAHRTAWVGDPPPPPPTTMPSDHARPGYDPDVEVHREYDPDRPFVWDMRPEVPLRMPDEFAIEDEDRAIVRERAMRQLYPDHDFTYDRSGLDGGDAMLQMMSGRTASFDFFAALGQYERALSFTADMDPERRKQLVKRREHQYPHLPGESFGEYGPQEAPAKQRKMTPLQRRRLRKQQQPKREALDPNALDDRIDMATLVKNALSRYHGATPEQLTQGKEWYAQARRQLQAIAQATGGDFSKAAGIMAALSPQLSWETNLNAGTHFLNAYDPTQRHKWRMPNVTPQALAQWNEVSGGRPPSTPEEFAAVANLAGISDPEWAKEMAMPGAWDRAVKAPAPANKPYTGTGMPALGDNVLRAMNVYDSDDPRKVLDYTSSPKVHSFWRNFLGDESFVTIDKHMLRALDRGFGQDPLMSYGKSTNDGDRKSPEDLRVNLLEKMLGYGQSQKGDEQTSVPTGYNSYAEAIRQATAQVNQGKDPSEHITPAQMQAIIWVQHKGDMDAFEKRKSQEAWDAKNPGKVKPAPKPYTPALPKQPIPEYTQSDEWAEANPYRGGEPRQKRVVGPVGPAMAPDNIVDVDVEPEPVPFVTPPPYEPRAASLDRIWLGALIEAQ